MRACSTGSTAERLRLSPGAERMLQTVQALGMRTLLVSGGFVHFTDQLKPRLKLDFTRANTLEIVDGKLTGQVVGEIVNADVKARTVREVCEQIGADVVAGHRHGRRLERSRVMAVAGLSSRFRAKPVVRAQASVAFNHVGLDGLLNLFPHELPSLLPAWSPPRGGARLAFLLVFPAPCDSRKCTATY